MDACKKMSCWFNLGSDEKTLQEYRRNATEGKNFVYFDEKKYFDRLEKEFRESMSAACSTVEISGTTRGRQPKKKSGELLPLEELVHIAKKQQQEQKQQIIITRKTSRRKRKSL